VSACPGDLRPRYRAATHLTRSAGVRVRQEGGKITVTDGPFTETKEVIGGYAILQAKDMAEAVEWTRRFAAVHEDEFDITCEVRQIDE
jgi:hypothetical protein